ncbi:ATP-binding protein [Bifidobacterium pseudocatenulatum]|uniref:sensor histidine kinase n=1 Tax=Bifidobacterium TaxID=1678 RepID=UPI001F1073F2|nr:ATP-binding protein [Bifidobacterium pseudocatenulatum]MCH4844111.1 ATPase [Bifidobacterium pseudocatenulatum]MDB6496753.1 ATP-binding protein [Bifidobacterium pseudocatenulatum]MDB6500863.1 ATP-binding protein [Bifidobacterium pseudocatenulatum]
MVESLGSWWRSLTHRNDDDEHDADDDTLDDATNALLSMLPLASVVVDEHDEVIRAHPSAYALGVVRDDAIAEETVLRAVHEVRSCGGNKQFDLTTTTQYVAPQVPKAGKPTTREIARQALIGQSNPNTSGATVSRPNWLKIIVGKLNENLMVVLISDVSESVRFSQVRDSFITNVSEQLLEPTQSLEQLADIVERGGASQQDVERNATQLRQSCSRLEHMISDLLLLIKAQEPILPTADNRINVMEQVQAVVQAHLDMAAQRGITIVTGGDESLCINGEADQIQAALAKLIENAITYSKDGSTVNVVAKANEEHTEAVISVLDRGNGIAIGEQNRIFERFYRGSNQNEHSGDGIGLGLAIVKHVALTHHGSASVWSSPGQGSTFALVLPLGGE